ncbi:tyrosine-type recombinase/integrase [Halorussus ruber]|uniref:tyrosine-type recombinase/integrase n=1 Tax=Halorussus ruber TaxID=1126238 RepID=UPI0010918C10|nr:phage integrase SAM-like domain-containing protein [Halorussus ruber]
MPTKTDQPLDAPLSDFLTDKSKRNDSGNYRRNAERVVREWVAWTNDERSTYTFAALDVTDLEAYARHLKRRTDDSDGLAASSARKYYDYVRAYLSWCQRRPYLAENPAKSARADEPLPDADEQADHEQQFWTPEQRKAIVAYVEERAYEAIDERGSDALAEARDRALVATVGYSGVRGGEVLRDRNDDRRDGVRWRDVDLDGGTMTILEKGKQEYTDTGVPKQAVRALDRWKQVFDPPNDEWPVFPTLHAPSLASAATAGLEAEGHDESEIEEIRDDATALEICYEYEIAPPALTTAGARNLMQRLSKAADVPGLDTEDGEYLELHGGRRGAGGALLRTKGLEWAQKHLKHANPDTTMKAYENITAEETAKEAGEAFDELDN